MKFVCFLVVLVLLPMPAMAYVDPNTGGLIFQILFPIFATIAGVLTFFRQKVKDIYSSLKQKLFKG